MPVSYDTYAASCDKEKTSADEKIVNIQKEIAHLESAHPKENKTIGLKKAELLKEEAKSTACADIVKQSANESLLAGNYFVSVDYQHNISSQNTKFPRVTRYGVDVTNITTSLPNAFITRNDPHPIESVLFGLVQGAFLDATHSEAYHTQPHKISYPDNVVLMDIFVRSDKDKATTSPDYCKMSYDERAYVETHTVVLLYANKDTLYLIDPNNSAYSRWLIGSSIINNDGDPFNIVMPFSNSYEIYKRGDNGKRVVGVFPDARDCVDISVKLAFELKEL